MCFPRNFYLILLKAVLNGTGQVSGGNVFMSIIEKSCFGRKFSCDALKKSQQLSTTVATSFPKFLEGLQGAFNKFPDFFVQAFIIAVNSRYFSMLLLYSL